VYIGIARCLRHLCARSLFISAWVWKSHFIGSYSCHREFAINIHKDGMLRFTTIPNLCWEEAPIIQKWAEKNCIFHGQMKRYSQKTNKDTLRYLIAIWSIGIARRRLNELIFVKTSISSTCFACSLKLAHAHSESFCQDGSHIVTKCSHLIMSNNKKYKYLI